MSIDSVISNTINNILIGDMYLSARNAIGQEFAQIYPERLEKVYTHKWTKDKIREERLVEYKDEAIEFSMRVYCKIKINGKLTTTMRLEVLTSLFYRNYQTATLHFMPFNIELLQGVHYDYKFGETLSEFIEHAFPELPTTCVHDYEQMKLTEDTLSGHKRRRDEILNM
jgi:hypothetical protein